MPAELTPKETRALQKADLLAEFERVKKQNLIASILCIFLGMLGAHRFYLGQHFYGGIIAALTISLVLMSLLAPLDLLYWEIGKFLIVVVFLLWLFQIYRVSADTDKVNDQIKRDLETKHFTF